jgi:hypothetical protein
MTHTPDKAAVRAAQNAHAADVEAWADAEARKGAAIKARMKNTAPHYHHVHRALDVISLRARECAVRGDMEHGARVLLADMATASTLLGRLAFQASFASDRAITALNDVARMLGVIGEDLNAHFTRGPEPLTPREIETRDAEERREREEV